MAKESCIEHPRGGLFIIIKQSYVNLFGGDHAYASLMYCFEHFTNIEIDRIDRSGEDIKPWVSAPMASIVSQVTGLFSERSLRPRIDALEKMGLLKVEKGRLGTVPRYLLDQAKVNTLLRSRRVFTALELDGSFADEKPPTSEATSATTAAELPTASLFLNTQSSEEKNTPPTPSENPPEPTHQDVINRINSEGYGLLGAGARSVVKATDISGLTLDEAVARCQAGLKNHRGVSARPSNARAPRQSRQAVQREYPKPERRSMQQLRTVTTDGHWLRDEWLMSFRERYNSINPATVDADWRDAYGPAIALTDEERAKAFEHILTCDGAWVKSPKNYLRDKEFLRPPRPEPKSNSQKLLEMA